MSSSNNPQLILDLDNTLRDVLNQPTTDNIHRCFSLIKQCYYRRLEEEKIIKDDSLYIPTILLLRQFQRFQNPTIFDQLLQEFILLFPLIPICSKKILDDLLCMTSIILTKRIMMTNDEVQQDLYLRFFRSLCLSIKTNREFFYREFLGNFNQNLPMIGHYLSCFLQLYEKIQTLDYRLNILETIWILFSLDCHENDYQEILGQILACFLPGILKTLVQDISTVHQRLIQSTLILLSYLVRCTLHPSTKEMVDQNSIKIELRQMIVERNDQWLMIVDGHLAPLLQRLTKDYLNHESVSVRRVLGIFMLSILAYSSNWLKISRNIAMKTMLALLSTNDLIILKILLGKLFKLPMESMPNVSSLLPYEDQLIDEILHANVSNQLLIDCQTDLFQLLDQEHISSSIFSDRQWRLQIFLGYYTFIHQQIDFLFNMETFTEKFLRFIFNHLDFQTLTRTNLHLLNETSIINDQPSMFNPMEYQSVYKHFNPDVHDQISDLMELFLRSHENFVEYLFEKINERKLIDETNEKIFYLLSICWKKKPMENLEDHQRILTFLNRLISEEKINRKQRRKKPKNDEPISLRNLTIYYLLHCLHTITPIHQTEYLIDYIPLLLLCHSSLYTIIHQTSLFCLTSIASNLPVFLISQSEYIVDTSLRKLQTSSYDGYLILIEFVRLGQQYVVNLPIMTHVIEQLLLELSCLPSIECIELTFQFFDRFCQQVIDINDQKKIKSTLTSSPSKSLIEFALDLQSTYHPPDASNDDEEKEKPAEHPWHRMLVSIVDVFQHYISHANPQIRSHVLDAFPSLAELLSTIDENLFLPLVHKLWPGLIHRLQDSNWNIRIRCLNTIQCLCRICSDFVDRRIRQDILPIVIQQLQSNRLLSSINTLEYRYMKCLLSNIGSIVNALTINLEDIEKIVLILFQYLQNDSLASIASEQLIILTRKYSDIIWLRLILHDENEYHKGYFNRMKVYKPEPIFRLDSKWKVNLLACLN